MAVWFVVAALGVLLAVLVVQVVALRSAVRALGAQVAALALVVHDVRDSVTAFEAAVREDAG